MAHSRRAKGAKLMPRPDGTQPGNEVAAKALGDMKLIGDRPMCVT